MRKPKYRAWIKEYKWMRNVDSISFKGELKPYVCEEHYYAPEEIELLQYTGLKDKNGVEIYEGDILKLLYAAADEDEKAQVLWRDGESAFMLWADYQVKRHLGSLVSSELEVIGNVYQNPEFAK